MNAVRYVVIAPLLIMVMSIQQQAAEIDDIVSGNNSFAFDLYVRTGKTQGNIFFSPYSISTALAMTYAGARTITEEEMATVLHFDDNQEVFHAGFSDLRQRIHESTAHESVALNIANSLWCQEDYAFLPEFLNLQQERYNTLPHLVDFVTKPEQTRRKINAWVEEQTNQRIKSLIPSGLISRLTVLVLCNAIHFKAAWETRFDESKTRDVPFSISPDKTVMVPMMSMNSTFKYLYGEGFTMLDLPYTTGSTSMVILLPDRDSSLEELHDRITWSNMKLWLDRLDGSRKESVAVQIPKFSMTMRFDLADTLAAMGMPHAFRGADFSGMTGTRDLFISDVVHKACIDVSEEGTESAAATAVIMKRGGGAPAFVADRPFFFLIRDMGTGTLLFMGRMTDPAARSQD